MINGSIRNLKISNRSIFLAIFFLFVVLGSVSYSVGVGEGPGLREAIQEQNNLTKETSNLITNGYIYCRHTDTNSFRCDLPGQIRNELNSGRVFGSNLRETTKRGDELLAFHRPYPAEGSDFYSRVGIRVVNVDSIPASSPLRGGFTFNSQDQDRLLILATVSVEYQLDGKKTTLPGNGVAIRRPPAIIEVAPNYTGASCTGGCTSTPAGCVGITGIGNQTLSVPVMLYNKGPGPLYRLQVRRIYSFGSETTNTYIDIPPAGGSYPIVLDSKAKKVIGSFTDEIDCPEVRTFSTVAAMRRYQNQNKLSVQYVISFGNEGNANAYRFVEPAKILADYNDSETFNAPAIVIPPPPPPIEHQGDDGDDGDDN